jgi:hypothetical protein
MEQLIQVFQDIEESTIRSINHGIAHREPMMPPSLVD